MCVYYTLKMVVLQGESTKERFGYAVLEVYHLGENPRIIKKDLRYIKWFIAFYIIFL